MMLTCVRGFFTGVVVFATHYGEDILPPMVTYTNHVLFVIPVWLMNTQPVGPSCAVLSYCKKSNLHCDVLNKPIGFYKMVIL